MDFKPANYPTVSPYLICQEAPRLIAFIESVFGGVLERRFDRPDGSLRHAEVRIEDSIVMIGGVSTEQQNQAAHLHVYVEDAHEAFARATAAGASIVQEPVRRSADQDLRAGVLDFAGNTWWMASQ